MIALKDNRLLIAVLIASQFAPPFMFSGVAVTLPAMGKEFHVGATTLSLVETLFLAAQLAFLLPIGRLADTNDKRNLYKLGLLCFGISSLLISFAPSILPVLFLRVVQGISSGLFATTGPAILADLATARNRGKVFGASTAMTYCGLMLGPFCAGLLTDYWQWQSVFIAGGLILLSGFLLVFFIMPSRWHIPSAKAVHLPSAALIAAIVFLFVFASTSMSWGVTGYLCLGLGVILIWAFIRLQKRIEQPLLNLSVLAANPTLRDAVSIQMLLYMYAFCSVFILNLFMQISLGQSPEMAGKIVALGSAIMVVTAPLAGVLADRYPARNITISGSFCVLIAAAMGAALHLQSELLYIGVMLAVQSFGFALFSSPNTKIIMESVPAEARGMAGAFSAKGRYGGMMLGMLLANLVISFEMGNEPLAHHSMEVAHITQRIFSLLIVFIGSSMTLSYFTRHRVQKFQAAR
jgi:MFS family permease